MQMTQQYLAGELSLLLARLPAVATNPGSLQAGLHLRHVVETVPLAALPFVLMRALELVDGLCWESLQRGDRAAFDHQAALGAQLHEFGLCARLLADGPAQGLEGWRPEKGHQQHS
jgi:hypothetical protein